MAENLRPNGAVPLSLYFNAALTIIVSEELQPSPRAYLERYRFQANVGAISAGQIWEAGNPDRR